MTAPAMPQKIGIYSGTFDPVHKGHVAFAREAIKQCGLAKVYFLVEPRPRRKQGVKALEHRQAMVKLAIAHEPKLGNIILDHARYSVSQTLPALQARFEGAEISFLMGDDMLHYFTDADWPRLEEFIGAVHLIIGLRSMSADEVQKQIGTIESTRGFKMRYQTFVTKQAARTSNEARQLLRRAQRPPGITGPVYRYIREHQLYLPADEQQ